MSLWKNLLLLGLSTLVTLVVVEVGIRRGWIPMPAYLNSSGWWKEAWFRTREGPIPRAFIELDPTLGWVPAPNLKDHKLDGALVSTNAAGLRGRRDYPLERTGRPRIVVIGDSYAFGQCASDDDTFPARLESLLPGSEVLNFGVMGYGHGQMLLRLREEALAYQPDVVVVGFHKMDMSRNRLSFRDYGKPVFKIDDGELELHNVPVPAPHDYDRALWPPRVANYASVLWDRLFWEDAQGDAVRLTNWILREMASEVQTSGARFALVYLPREEDVRDDDPYPVHVVKRACAEEGVLCASPSARIRDALAGQDLGDHFGCHYSPEVYGLVAEETAALLRREMPDVFGGGS